jgi:hypothetical protein
MTRFGRTIAFAVFAFVTVTTVARAETVIERPDLDALFVEHGTAGTFVLLDVAA